MAVSGRIRVGWRTAGFWVAFAIAASLRAAPTLAASDAQILYFEPLQISVPQTNAGARGKSQTSARELSKLQLSAFGREYSLSVQANESFHESLSAKPSRSSLTLYRGSIEGLNGSWVRLATQGTDVHGMLWDGIALYVIAPSDEVQSQLVPPLDAPSGAVIFRLQDVLMPAAQSTCAAAQSDAPERGSHAYDSLVRELQSAQAKGGLGATVRLELSVLADALFRERYLDEQSARDSILIRLNNIDGIYSSELGVQMQAPRIELLDASSRTLSNTTSADALLKELSRARDSSNELRSRGLTHLFTGRNLDGTTVGIAYVDSLCDSKYGVGLTEVSTRGSWYESLIAAHEIGHNFGAVHDGEVGKACASTPQGLFLMSPNVNGVDSFSDCSISLMQPRISAARCITPLPAANIRVAPDLGTVRRSVETSFEYELPVTNAGGATSMGVRAEIIVPPTLTVEDAYVIGGSCTSGAGVVECQLGDIAGGTSRPVHFMLNSKTVGTYTISADVSAANETNTSDNRGTGTIAIDRETDVSVAIEAPGQVAATSPFELRFTVANSAEIDARDVRTALQLPPGFSVTSAAQTNGTCTMGGTEVSCVLSRLAPGESSSGTLRLNALQAGRAVLRVETSGSYVDPVGTNDSAEASVEVTPAATPSAVQSNGGGSGGGGSLNVVLLGLLSLLGLWRRSGKSA